MLNVARVRSAWEWCGAQIHELTPAEHDRVFAAVSHLPHLLAFAMMNAVNSQPQAKDYLSLAGPGFRDFTRIAASDPKMWRDVLLANREELLSQARVFKDALQVIERTIESGNGDALENLINQASTARAHWRMGAAPKK